MELIRTKDHPSFKVRPPPRAGAAACSRTQPSLPPSPRQAISNNLKETKVAEPLGFI